MNFNEKKCKVMHFGRKNPCHDYTMNGLVLEKSKCEKDVGVHVSDDLKPSAHCAKASATANTILGMMARCFHFRDKNIWIKLYKTYVRPHLEYAAPAWNPWLQRDIQVLEKVQERAVRMCSGLRGGNYNERLIELNLDSLELRRKKIDLTQVWKILSNFDNIEETRLFERLHTTAVRATRANSSEFNLRQRNVNLDVRKFFFSNRVTNDWNALPEEIKSARKISTFKNLLDKHLLR